MSVVVSHALPCGLWIESFRSCVPVLIGVACAVFVEILRLVQVLEAVAAGVVLVHHMECRQEQHLRFPIWRDDFLCLLGMA